MTRSHDLKINQLGIPTDEKHFAKMKLAYKMVGCQPLILMNSVNSAAIHYHEELRTQALLKAVLGFLHKYNTWVLPDDLNVYRCLCCSTYVYTSVTALSIATVYITVTSDGTRGIVKKTQMITRTVVYYQDNLSDQYWSIA